MGGRILVVDDEEPQQRILRLILEAEAHSVATASGGRQALAALATEDYDLVLTDLKMPDLGGIALLEALLKSRPGLCVILLTAHGTIDSAVEAMRKGAFDYLTKPLDKDVLLLAIDRGLAHSRLLRENVSLREQLRDRYSFESIVGEHGSMQDVFRMVRKVAPSTATVLIYGESGTGKELVARALHMLSPRRDRPFIGVNVSALPEGVLEAELFGHERGAFTGALARRAGLFEVASGSTLFLDEVGELKRDLQVKLLRVLQEREIQRVGGSERVPVDVRIVAATNRDLQQAVRSGEFREDLYYRLNVIPIGLPPLRERVSDVPLLVDHFLARNRDGRTRSVSPEAMAELARYRWPGNVRELESVLERAMLLAEGDVIGPADLPSLVRVAPAALDDDLPDLPEQGLDLSRLEQRLIQKALARTGGNVTRAARLLGLTRRTLQYRLERDRATGRSGAESEAEAG